VASGLDGAPHLPARHAPLGRPGTCMSASKRLTSNNGDRADTANLQRTLTPGSERQSHDLGSDVRNLGGEPILTYVVPLIMLGKRNRDYRR
jgi:hypothetical protein